MRPTPEAEARATRQTSFANDVTNKGARSVARPFRYQRSGVCGVAPYLFGGAISYGLDTIRPDLCCGRPDNGYARIAPRSGIGAAGTKRRRHRARLSAPRF